MGSLIVEGTHRPFPCPCLCNAAKHDPDRTTEERGVSNNVKRLSDTGPMTAARRVCSSKQQTNGKLALWPRTNAYVRRFPSSVDAILRSGLTTEPTSANNIPEGVV